MSNFICPKCKHNFAGKRELERHLNKVFDCISGSKTGKKNIKKFRCSACKLSFARKGSLTRHHKTCKKYHNNSKKIKKWNNNINNDISGNKNIIDNSKKKITNNSNTNSNNTNIVIINFARDKLIDFGPRDLSKMLKSDHNLIEKLVSIVNFNPNKPNHHNIYYCDIKSAYGEVYINKKWKKKKIDEILDTLLDAKIEDLNDILNDYEDIISKKHIKRIKDTIDSVNVSLSRSDARKKLRSYLKPILFNGKNMVIATKNKLDCASQSCENFDISEDYSSREEDSNSYERIIKNKSKYKKIHK